MNKTSDNFSREVPQSCLVQMMKKVLIEKLPAKYFLASHPYPKIEGEMIIFRPNKEDQDPEDKSLIVYRDFSLRKRIETTQRGNYATDSLAKKKRGGTVKKEEEKGEPEHKPNLQCLDIDITKPLTPEEWNNTMSVLDETKGLGWFQVLPVGQKSSQPYQFNMIHVLPQAKIPVETLPLDAFISNKISLERKKEQSRGANAMMTTA